MYSFISSLSKVETISDNFIKDTKGVFGDILSCLHYRELKKLHFLVNDLLKKDSLLFLHPVLKNETYSTTSKQIGLCNFVFFKGDDAGSEWVIVQHSDCVNLIITNGYGAFSPFDIFDYVHSKEAYNEALKFFNNEKDLGSYFDRCNKLKGVMINSPRPHHFFYDKYRNFLSLKLPLDKKILENKSTFLSGKAAHPNNEVVHKKEKEAVFWSVACLSHNQLLTVRDDYVKECTHEMEDFIKSYSISEHPEVSRKITPVKSVSIWIGITGQKRAWVEQVEGYSKIIKMLALQYSRVEVNIDGMTSKYGEKESYPEDLDVANEIIRCCNNYSNIFFEILVGLDYIEKSAICNNVSCFIANAGSGCLVPLRFSKKDGVVHSNTKLISHPDSYGKNISFIDKKYVKDIGSGHPMHISYSIDWEVVYNALADILGCKKI
ncbi:hypothetical protein [Vreelandella sp. EE27]